MKRNLLCATLAIAILTGCDEKTMSDGSLTESCRPTGGGVGLERREPHPARPTECKWGVLLVCNVCVYSNDGGLSHSASQVCGACIGGSF